MLEQQGKREITSQFRIVMEEFEGGMFESCQGLEVELEVVYHVEGGKNMAPRATRGAPKPSLIVFGKGTLGGGKTGKKGIFEWLMDVVDYSKPLKRQTLTIQLLDAEGKAQRTWRVRDAWPCRWSGPALSAGSADLAVEYVAFAHEGITA